MRRLVRLLLMGRPDGVRRRLVRALLERLLGPPAPADGTPTGAPAPPPPAALRQLLPLVDLVDGQLTETLLDGVPVVVVRRGTRVHVLDATCPHAGGPLGDGDLEGDALVCPLHGWRFDLATGACDVDPSQVVAVHAAEVVDGVVCVPAAP